jgi:hypothetical protein
MNTLRIAEIALIARNRARSDKNLWLFTDSPSANSLSATLDQALRHLSAQFGQLDAA